MKKTLKKEYHTRIPHLIIFSLSVGAYLCFGLGERCSYSIYDFQYRGRSGQVIRTDMRYTLDRYRIQFSNGDKIRFGEITDDLGHRLRTGAFTFYLDDKLQQ